MARINFQEIAKQEVTLAKIMENRDKIETEQIISDYPDGIHIDEIEKIAMQKEEGLEIFWAFHFTEEPDCFAFAGIVLGKIFDKFQEVYEGELDELAADLKEEPLGVILESGKTKDGKRNVTTVKIN